MWSFGVITDTHVRSPEGDQSSPYPVNDKANDRARYACELLASQDPAFVVHLGDMVHPLPAMPSYDAACQAAMALFEPLKPRLHFVAGNHDVGDKPMPGSPAAIVNDAALAKYTQWFGKSWYAHDVGQLRLIIINSSLINTGTDTEKEQFSWLSQLLADSQEYRVILFSHYPLFVHDANEAEHYDNIASPGRQRLLELIKTHSIDMVLSGHVHHFFYNCIDSTQFFTLPSTCFTRQDYADLFKSAPANEYGRDDADKLAVTMVDVFPDTFKLRVIPTSGIEQKDSSDSSATPAGRHAITRTSAKPLTVSMRHPWHESIDLPYNGPMEEFTRKRARNDYTILRLMQLGIHQLRIPMQDLLEPSVRQRVEDCRRLGFEYTVVCLQNDWTSASAALHDIESSVQALEYILPNEQSHWRLPANLPSTNTPVYLGLATSGAHDHSSTKPFAHTVSSGFPMDQLEAATDWYRASVDTQTDAVLGNFVVQLPWEGSVDDSARTLESWLTQNPGKLFLNVRLARSNPADENSDQAAISQRIDDVIQHFGHHKRVSLQLDTFMSLDRGYSPRTGLVDRLGNLTQVGRHLMSS